MHSFNAIWILSPSKKNISRVGPPLTKLSGSAHVYGGLYTTIFNCFKLLTAAPKAEVKMYSCDVDICDTEGSPVCKPLEEPGPGLLDMEGRDILTLSLLVPNFVILGITVFKIFIWGGISLDIQSKV